MPAQENRPLLDPSPWREPTSEPQKKGFLKKTAHALRPGFAKSYNHVLFCIFSFGVAFFSLARLKYLSVAILAAELNPGDWYYMHNGFRHVGFMLHLACMLPVGLLMIPQFVPRIRRNFLMFHRVNGYTIILLTLVGNVGALLIARRGLGGDVAAQAATGLLVIMSTTGLILAWWNIRNFQIDLHRAWMLRSMFWIASIVSTRLIMPLAALVMTAMGTYYIAWPCDELKYVLGASTMHRDFPQCTLPNGTTDGYVAVKAELDFSKPAGIGAVFNLNFGMGLFLALFLHVIGVEIYLALTPVEAERLRLVSYEKQMEAGWKDAGNAGTTVQNWGDAPAWYPTV